MMDCEGAEFFFSVKITPELARKLAPKPAPAPEPPASERLLDRDELTALLAEKDAEIERLRARIAELEAREVTLTGALKDLADDHEFGATGTVRQDHLQAARAALRGEEVDRGE
jgi:hypothetical protein